MSLFPITGLLGIAFAKYTEKYVYPYEDQVIRNSGKYTFVDIVSYRLDAAKIRPAVAVTVFVISLAYLIPQMVAAGALSRILFGISDTAGILIVGGLMIVYVSLGGMMAATWIQSIKAVFLLVAGYLLAALTMSHFDFSVPQLLRQWQKART